MKIENLKEIHLLNNIFTLT